MKYKMKSFKSCDEANKWVEEFVEMGYKVHSISNSVLDVVILMVKE